MGGYGGSFHNWLLNPKTVYEDVMMEDGSTKTFMRDVREPYNSWGNGSAMRTSAVGWMFDTLKETERVAEIQAAVTHNHPEGIKGAQATSAAIFMARNGKTKDEIKRYIETRFGYDLSRSCDEIRPWYTFNESCQGTVPQAITAFLESTDFESCIRLGVSLGGDSDTLACIAGGIAEAFYKDIPKWIVDEVWRRLPYAFKGILDRLHKDSYYCEVNYIPHTTKEKAGNRNDISD
jgi:ADP-ribosylglycohydrolase